MREFLCCRRLPGVDEIFSPGDHTTIGPPGYDYLMLWVTTLDSMGRRRGGYDILYVVWGTTLSGRLWTTGSVPTQRDGSKITA